MILYFDSNEFNEVKKIWAREAIELDKFDYDIENPKYDEVIAKSLYDVAKICPELGDRQIWEDFVTEMFENCNDCEPEDVEGIDVTKFIASYDDIDIDPLIKRAA
jgi:hypothetical protein